MHRARRDEPVVEARREHVGTPREVTFLGCRAHARHSGHIDPAQASQRLDTGCGRRTVSLVRTGAGRAALKEEVGRFAHELIDHVG